ncbi:unnamed protein product [Brassica oleracea]
MWVDMLMIDINATIMQATIYANRLQRFRSKLAAGKMFSLSAFFQGMQIAELGRLLMYEASREWLLERLSPYRFCTSHHTRDVKSANILLDKNFMAKFSELGLPKTGPYFDQTHVSLTVKGSFGYLLDQVPITEEI